MVVLSFESVDKIPWCTHSNETSIAVLPHGTIYNYLRILQNEICELSCILIFGNLAVRRPL